MLKLCLTVILLGCATQINCESLPAFIWGQRTASFLPALNQLNGDEFVTLVKSQTDKDTLTVVFVENSLSVEDLSQCKLKTETCFENLRKIQTKTYLTAVEDPVGALKSSYAENKQKSISLSNDGDLSEKLDEVDVERLLFVYLDDVERSEDFAKHDELISKLYNSIASKRENVIAIYTARHPSFVYSKSLVRKARDTEAKQEGTEKPNQVVKFVEKKFLIAMSKLKVGETVVDLSTLAVTLNGTEEESTSRDINLKAGDQHNIGIKFELSGGTWSAKHFSYNNGRFFTRSPVSAYDHKSFGCVELRLSNAKIEIVFDDIQIQPFFHPLEEGKEFVFSKSVNDCTGFFSAAIWGALFVVIILLSILSCGLTAMMDIRTMDRFDDPKGKTITINAQE